MHLSYHINLNVHAPVLRATIKKVMFVDIEMLLAENAAYGLIRRTAKLKDVIVSGDTRSKVVCAKGSPGNHTSCRM